MRIRVNAPRARVNGPPLRKKKHGPLCKCPPPPLERRNTARAIDKGGGVVCLAACSTHRSMLSTLCPLVPGLQLTVQSVDDCQMMGAGGG